MVGCSLPLGNRYYWGGGRGRGQLRLQYVALENACLILLLLPNPLQENRNFLNTSPVTYTTGPLVRFLMAHGLSALALGIHLVMLSWLSVGVLDLPAMQVGWVQVAGLVPSLLSIMYAGWLADRRNPVILLVGVQVALASIFVCFSLVLFQDWLNFVTLLVYGVAISACNGLVQPLREKLLMRLDEAILQRKISSASAVQFACQAAGVLLVTLTAYIELSTLFTVQALVSVLAAVLYCSLIKAYAKANRVAVDGPAQSDVEDTDGSWRNAWHSLKREPGLKHILLLAGFNGYMHLGVFVVALPLLARDSYGLDSQAYALLQFTFMIGLILANIRLLTIKKVTYPGQGALFSLLYTAVVGIAVSLGPTLTGLYMLIGAWGWVAGNSAGLSRMVLQSLVPFEAKGRMMALYQVVLFGFAPLGALVTGYVLHWFDLNVVFVVMSVSSALLFVAFLFSRTLWGIKQRD